MAATFALPEEERRNRLGPWGMVAAAAVATVGLGFAWSPSAGGVESSATIRDRAAAAAHVTLSGAVGELTQYRMAVQVVARRVAEQKAAQEAAKAAEAAAAAQAAAEAEAARQAAAAQAAAEAAAQQAAAEEAARQEAEYEARQAARRAAQAQQAVAAAPAPVAAQQLVAAVTAPAAQNSEEARFLALINNARAQAGLGGLQLDGQLQSAARSWAQQLSVDGSLHHQNVGAFLGTWMTAGENIAYGPSADSMFSALIASPAHYENIMKGSFTAVGIGVVPGADGKLWTSHVFAG